MCVSILKVDVRTAYVRSVPVTASLENSDDISEPQISPNERNNQYIQFSTCLFSFNLRNCFSPIETD